MCQKHKKQSIQTKTEKLNNIKEAVSSLLRQLVVYLVEDHDGYEV